ncbi:hypothetical protein [Waddlia chondrophila]|uniref:Uncharacterized protein n=1 Tax=Waddlia chondrophila (strain ATCC VR-1470 / WSU 86-1044) TaxID=716544 RepID=D6YUW1_WADCW|nr:hypothetical protein [Waddlia chondrophila]ADI37922.1 hypothetical protein wcw_0552 [Waddlia chondrophila WSU 86-1044]
MKQSSIAFWFLSFIFTLSFSNQNWAQEYQPVENGDVHEAFVTRVAGNILIDAHSKPPPTPIRERIPRQTDNAAIWLGGYWAWSDSKQDYIWTSGVWRRPPPGHQWIDGFWKEFNDGWAWIPGFWSDKNLSQLSYINLAPPSAIDENVPSAPQDNYFWNPGFWWYNPNANEYEWVDGRWEELDPNWVLIPAHYTWRPEGYVFIDAYWDWPLDSLGEAYEPVYIPPAQRETIVYEPTKIVEVSYIIDHYFYTYPDYTSFYYHHFHYHPHYWENHCCAPQWWLWDTWWGLSWSNQWGLWWWYSNPGYPAPLWITGNISSTLPPPRPALYNHMKKVRPPEFITPRGIVPPNTILKETQRISGSRRPIFPSNRAQRDKIWQEVSPKGNEKIRPEGRPRPFNPDIRRSSLKKPRIDTEPVQRVPRAPEGRLPKIPKRPERPSVPQAQKPDIQRRPPRRPDGEQPPIRRPTRPRVDFDRPDFERPAVRQPSRSRLKLPRESQQDVKRPGFDRLPERRTFPPIREIRQPEKPRISYPPGFREGPSEEIQRQPQRVQPRRNQPSEIRQEIRKRSDSRRDRRQKRREDDQGNSGSDRPKPDQKA